MNAHQGTTRRAGPVPAKSDPPPAALSVTREVCRDYEKSSRLEWLETNGTGGFAMGTAAGVNTRRYHGLLVAALRPPVDRFVVLSKLEETVEVDGIERDLATTQYPGVVAPQGFRALESFRRDPFPTWTWTFGGTVVEKQIFLVRGKQTVIVQYRANRGCRLSVRPFLAYRDFHSLAVANDAFDGQPVEERRSADVSVLHFTPYRGLPTLSLHHNGVAGTEAGGWYHRAEYLAELERGLDFREDLYGASRIEFALSPDRPAWLVASLEADESWDRVRVAQEEAIEREHRRPLDGDPMVSRLTLAADAFRVRRADGSPTVIAGYPWFADWGRDTMIALPGNLLVRGLLEEAREVLDGFLAHLDGGLVPNRFADSGQPPEYNTVDGTLWMWPRSSPASTRTCGRRRWARSEKSSTQSRRIVQVAPRRKPGASPKSCGC